MTHTPDNTALVSVIRQANGTVLRLEAPRIDYAVAEALKARLKQAVPDGPGAVSLDLARVEFIDSSGLGALVALRKHLPEERRIRLVGPTPFVERVLRLTCLDHIFEIAS